MHQGEITEKCYAVSGDIMDGVWLRVFKCKISLRKKCGDQTRFEGARYKVLRHPSKKYFALLQYPNLSQFLYESAICARKKHELMPLEPKSWRKVKFLSDSLWPFDGLFGRTRNRQQICAAIVGLRHSLRTRAICGVVAKNSRFCGQKLIWMGRRRKFFTAFIS